MPEQVFKIIIISEKEFTEPEIGKLVSDKLQEDVDRNAVILVHQCQEDDDISMSETIKNMTNSVMNHLKTIGIEDLEKKFREAESEVDPEIDVSRIISGCKITDNARNGDYDDDSSFLARMCPGDCDKCSHYYEKKEVKD